MTTRSVHILQKALTLLGGCVHHELYDLLLAIADSLSAGCRHEPLLGLGFLHACTAQNMRAQRWDTGLSDRLGLRFKSWQRRTGRWDHLELVDDLDCLPHVEGQRTERGLDVDL